MLVVHDDWRFAPPLRRQIRGWKALKGVIERTPKEKLSTFVRMKIYKLFWK